MYCLTVVVYKHEIIMGTLASEKPRKSRIAIVSFFFGLNNFKMVLSSIVGCWNNIFAAIYTAKLHLIKKRSP